MSCRSCFVAGLFAAMLPLPVSSTGPQETLRSRVEGVRIDVTVTDGSTPVRALAAEDFEVFDNDVRQTIQSARSAERLSLALALDTSGSVVFGRMEHYGAKHPKPVSFERLIAAANAILSSLNAGDEVSLLTFSDRLSLAVPPTHDTQAIRTILSGFQRPGAVSLHVRSTVWDATFAAASLVAGRPGRPVVVLLSDTADNSSWSSQSGVIAALRRTGVSVDLIAVPRTYDIREDMSFGALEVNAVADRTGGRAFTTRDRHLPEKLRDRVDALRSGYIITYMPTGVGQSDGWHKLRVRVRDKNGKVEARPGYYAGS